MPNTTLHTLSKTNARILHWQQKKDKSTVPEPVIPFDTTSVFAKVMHHILTE